MVIVRIWSINLNLWIHLSPKNKKDKFFFYLLLSLNGCRRYSLATSACSLHNCVFNLESNGNLLISREPLHLCVYPATLSPLMYFGKIISEDLKIIWY